jgi:hypothetical protein
MSQYSPDGHLPEPTKGEVKSKLSLNKNTYNSKDKRKSRIHSKRKHDLTFIGSEHNEQEAWPKDIELFFNS